MLQAFSVGTSKDRHCGQEGSRGGALSSEEDIKQPGTTSIKSLSVGKEVEQIFYSTFAGSSYLRKIGGAVDGSSGRQWSGRIRTRSCNALNDATICAMVSRKGTRNNMILAIPSTIKPPKAY
jgi:hypothetical protein